MTKAQVLKRISLKDVARAAGYSLSTVSLALRDSPKVAPQAKRRIRSVAKKLNYSPSFVARRLSSRQSRVIGVVLPPIRSDMGTEMLFGVSEQVAERDFTLLIEYTGGDYAREVAAVKRLIDEHVDGVLINSVVLKEDMAHLLELRRRGVPFVQMDVKLPHVESDYVASDNRGGAFKVMRHLLERGHRRIAYVSNALIRNTLQERLEGYQLALSKEGLEVDPSLVAAHPWMDLGSYTTELSMRKRSERGYPQQRVVKVALEARKGKILETMRGLFERQEPPSGIFVAHLGSIASVLWALRHLGLRVPEDVSLVAFDDLSFLPALGVELTTMIQDAFLIGYEAARLLIDRIEGKDTGDFHAVHCEPALVVGNTVGMPPFNLS